METLDPGDDYTSPASPTGNLDLRRLSTHAADSAYSSFSATSGGPEPRTPSPGTDPLPYLDWNYVRLVWGGPPSPALRDPVLPSTRQLGPAVSASNGPRAPELQGAPGPLSRQATPLLYALAQEAAVRTTDPPSPPAARAAYRQRLQGAQGRVLRETSFQRRELRMSLPGRLRPAIPTKPPTVHPRSASLSYPGREAKPAHSGAHARGTTDPGCLAHQQRAWCFSEPGKLHRMGWGGGQGLGELSPGSGFLALHTQELQPEPRVERIEFRTLWETQPPSAEELDNCPRTRTRRSHSTSEDIFGPCREWERMVASAKTVRPEAETPMPLLQTKVPRVLTQNHAAENPQNSPIGCKQRVSQSCAVSTRLSSLSDADVFWEEILLPRPPAPPESHASQRLPIRVLRASDHCEDHLSRRAGRATIAWGCSLQECPGTIGPDDCCQGSVGASSRTSCSPPGTASVEALDPPGLLTTDPSAAAWNDPRRPPPIYALSPSDSHTPSTFCHRSLGWGPGQAGGKSPWPSQRFEGLLQELAVLEPFLSDALASQCSPELPPGLLDGLIPPAEAWDVVRPACGEDGEETYETGTCLPNLTQQPPTSPKEAGSDSSPSQPMPDQPNVQDLPVPHNRLQTKKVALAHLLQKMLQELRWEQERLQGTKAAWSRLKAALEAAVAQACATRELERFSRFMTDLERVLGLLLLLGSRLARVHLALARADPEGDPDEQACLLQRLRLLQRQQEDARELKEHVARRERALRQLLQRALSAEHLRSYCVLLAAKAAILAQQRSLDERIRLLQDHLDTTLSDLSHRPLSPRLS